MVQVYVFLLGEQDKHRGFFLHILDVFVEEGTASVQQARKLRYIPCVWGLTLLCHAACFTAVTHTELGLGFCYLRHCTCT